jgi:hypothetical protein
MANCQAIGPAMMTMFWYLQDRLTYCLYFMLCVVVHALIESLIHCLSLPCHVLKHLQLPVCLVLAFGPMDPAKAKSCSQNWYKLQLPMGYNKLHPDRPRGRRQSIIDIAFGITHLQSVSESNAMITVQMEMFMFWDDTRISNATDCERPIPILNGSAWSSTWSEIWKPDPYVYSSYQIRVMPALEKNLCGALQDPQRFRMVDRVSGEHFLSL